MTSVDAIYGLALPPIQNPGYSYALNNMQYAYISDTGCCILVLLMYLHKQ